MVTTGIPGLPWLPLEYQVCHDYHWNTRSEVTGIARPGSDGWISLTLGGCLPHKAGGGRQTGQER